MICIIFYSVGCNSFSVVLPDYVIIKEYPDRRSIGIIMLTSSAGPEKGRQEYKRKQYAAAYQKKYHVHISLFLRANALTAIVVKDMMVMVLSGISTAAIKGES